MTAVKIDEDLKWYKIQLNAVRIRPEAGDEPFSADTLHEELAARNPIYAEHRDSIAQRPRRTRTAEELNADHAKIISSVVSATTDAVFYNRVINEKRILSAFFKLCSAKPFLDRPPVTQCKRCWTFEHDTTQCTRKAPACR